MKWKLFNYSMVIGYVICIIILFILLNGFTPSSDFIKIKYKNTEYYYNRTLIQFFRFYVNPFNSEKYMLYIYYNRRDFYHFEFDDKKYWEQLQIDMLK